MLSSYLGAQIVSAGVQLLPVAPYVLSMNARTNGTTTSRLTLSQLQAAVAVAERIYVRASTPGFRSYAARRLDETRLALARAEAQIAGGA